MDTKAAFSILKETALVDWAVLHFGWRKSWVTRREVDYYLMFPGEMMRLQECSPASALPSPNAVGDPEICELLTRLARVTGAERSVGRDKWRFALLLALQRSEASREVKLEMLDLMTSRFDYPADMEQCTLHSMWSGRGDPLTFMDALIEQLRVRYLPEHTP